MFQGLADKAADYAETSAESTATDPKQTNETETQQTESQTSGLAPELKSFRNEQEGKQPLTREEIADLSKYDKVKLPDGTVVSRDELAKERLRQQDYTRKTQELAKQRAEVEQYLKERDAFKQERENLKYETNYALDLEKVMRNPDVYLKKFLDVYPKQFHERLFQDLKQQDSQGQQERASIDPRYAELMKETWETKQLLNQFMQQRHQEELMAFDATLDSLESKFKTQYPNANIADVYARLDKFAIDNGIQSVNQINKDEFARVFEKEMKQSHQEMEKRFEEWSKTQVKKQMEANKRGSDIGKGGGTPTQAPAKTKLKDVGDLMIRQMREAGEL